MSKRRVNIAIGLVLMVFTTCKKSSDNIPVTADPNFTLISAQINGKAVGSSNFANTTIYRVFIFYQS
jgi:hypothetical protein